MKSTRGELKNLATARLRDAKILLDAGCFDGAYYLTGLSVECALKACIAEQTRRHDFPDKQVVQDSWTHSLEKLLKTAGLQSDYDFAIKRDPHLSQYWAIVKDWDVEARYVLNRSRQSALDLYRAVAARRSGVLQWIKLRW